MIRFKNPPKYAEQYNTELTPEQRKGFEAWAVQRYGSLDRAMKELEDYDLQGAWLNLPQEKLGEGHLPDTYKKPNHITFSNESKYSTPEAPGGVWVQDSVGWKFTPAKHTIDRYGIPTLQKYFKEREPNAQLLP